MAIVKLLKVTNTFGSANFGWYENCYLSTYSHRKALNTFKGEVSLLGKFFTSMYSSPKDLQSDPMWPDLAKFRHYGTTSKNFGHFESVH